MSWPILESKLGAVAPDLLQSLEQGASAEEIEILQDAFGRDLPRDFVTAWLRHNGQTQNQRPDGSYTHRPLFAMLELLDTREIASEWHYACEAIDDSAVEDATEPVRPDVWRAGWLPIVLIGGESAYLCIDLAPGPGGKTGQIIYASPKDDTRKLVAANLDDLFVRLADATTPTNIVNGAIAVLASLGLVGA